jgi:beta-lactamase superfamily II metal-dependent hydrolase
VSSRSKGRKLPLKRPDFLLKFVNSRLGPEFRQAQKVFSVHRYLISSVRLRYLTCAQDTTEPANGRNVRAAGWPVFAQPLSDVFTVDTYVTWTQNPGFRHSRTEGRIAVRKTFGLVFVTLLLLPSLGIAQANGNLQIHFMDVGQGDGAVLISPQGETVVFDNGVWRHCDKPLSYLQQLGVTKIDYEVISHFHADHLGCTSPVLHTFPLQHESFDRGSSYHGDSYTAYVDTLGSHRKTPNKGDTITLDAGSASAVTITFVALNGNDVVTDNENDLSLVAVVSFGELQAEIGGDLSGFAENDYADIESGVATAVKQVEVYKVHHHGSRYSTNEEWLGVVKPKIGIVPTGEGNRYNHPTEECLERLHHQGVKTYWTSEGNGTEPEAGMDVVAGNVIVEVVPGAHAFSVRGTNPGLSPETYPTWEAGTTSPPSTPSTPPYSWSKKSSVYHYSSYRFVQNISPDNLQTGTVPPSGKTPHKDCPR